ncbi:MAG: ABC transporter ATP-binding protein [Sulfolobales archaeon]|uniref:ABC transporter ATP-binding protein n=1 Tax=Thermoprotei TaxID=183924 RepID=UPI00315E29A0
MEILRIEDLYVYFPIKRGLFGQTVGYVKAVDGVSLDVSRGDGLAIVGETGSGKSTILRVILKLQKPTRGKVFFEGRDIFSLTRSEESWYRRKVQAVFQNPFQSLNPRMRVYDILVEPLKRYMKLGKSEVERRVRELLELVGLSQSVLNQYSASLSGGQAQRVAIARALAINPELVLLDEPTSALDVSIQAQILNLLQELRHKLNVTYLLVTHDLAIVSSIVEKIAVLYRGNIVEIGSVNDIFSKPLHPYTQALIASIPDPFKDIANTATGRFLKEEEVYREVSGCKLAYRCPYAEKKCFEKRPPLHNIQGRLVACWLYA